MRSGVGCWGCEETQISQLRNAIVWEAALWLGGAVLVALLRPTAVFSRLAVSVAFLTLPAIWVVARLHLRHVPPVGWRWAGLQLGAAIAAVQFVLDLIGWLVVFSAGWPPLPSAPQRATVLALEVGYL
ncbi:MAG: hypothetical protein ABIK79_10650 [Chloroflexota bacterium]